MTINIEDVRPGDVITLEHPDGSRLVRDSGIFGLTDSGGCAVEWEVTN